jgi:transposase
MYVESKKKSYVLLFVYYLSLFGYNPNNFCGGSLVTATVWCMPTCTISKDLKAQIPASFHQQGFNIKKTVVYQALSYAHAYGVPYNPHAHKPGRKHALSQGDLKFIVALLNYRNSLYLDEIQKQLCNEHRTFVSIRTLLYTLRRLHYSYKGASAHALERDDLLHSAFMNRIAELLMKS